MSKILGVNKRYYPMAPIFEREIATIAVLVAGDIGDYACYIGLGYEPENDADWIAAHGDKISFEEACCHFPGGQLKKEKYRY